MCPDADRMLDVSSPLEVIGERDSGKLVEVEVGQSVVIRLPENPTTGFRWSVIAGGDVVCTFVRDEFQGAAIAVPGAGGEHVWEMRADAAGETLIKLACRRRSQKEDPPQRTFSLRIRVVGG